MAVLEPETTLLDRKRSEYVPHVAGGVLWFEARQKEPKDHFDRGSVVSTLGDNMGNGLSSYFPAKVSFAAGSLLDADRVANLAPRVASMPAFRPNAPESVFLHAVAVLNSPQYRLENRDALIRDWPRLPMPATADTLADSAGIGSTVAALLNPSVTFDGDIKLGSLCRVQGGSLEPATDLGLTAHWGIRGQGGITMPSTGKFIERAYSDNEIATIADAAERRHLSHDQAIALLGETCLDVYLNDVAYWRCVPANVWRYTIGGYQVIKKWLSYRERALLGRDLKPEEARYVTEMVRRIAALVLMGPELDANYELLKSDTWQWGSEAAAQSD
jgi:hypothetical protein